MSPRSLKTSKKHTLLAALVLMMGAGPAAAADKLVYMNDWLPGGDKALVFYAMQKGLFTEKGIDLTIQNARGSSEAITRIATGSADVGSGRFRCLAAGARLRARFRFPRSTASSPCSPTRSSPSKAGRLPA